MENNYSYSMQSVGDSAELTENPGKDIAYAIWGTVHTAAIGASVYHGYKRNDSIGWAIGWGLLGALFPIITIPVAVAQGFGEPKSS